MLSVGRTNARARRFYERAGWTHVPERAERPSVRYRLELPGTEDPKE
jgi:ribosomal protein S18 acetylase RimI-like enzyme